MRLNFYFLFFLLTNFCFSQNDSIDNLTYLEKLNSGNYYPYFKFTKEDKFKLPIEFQVEVSVDELLDLDIKNNKFYAVLLAAYSTTIDTIIVTKNDTIYFDSPSDFFYINYPESDRTYDGGIDYDGKVYYSKLKDSVNQWSHYIETELPHKWDLRNYPFDKQNLKIVFQTKTDTSWFKLNSSVEFPPKIYGEKFHYLIDGLHVKNFTTEKKYNQSSVALEFPNGKRNEVREQLIFNIEIDRSGSYLYFKLFFGGFLSFLISFLVYFIDSRFFETRITLSLGGIFGAVGNKYFVENSMPSIQVLTKADLINNLVIIFIILNIFIVISQHTSKISIWKFEKNKFSALFILALFIFFNFLIIII
jgi:hypothetical protein